MLVGEPPLNMSLFEQGEPMKLGEILVRRARYAGLLAVAAQTLVDAQ